MIKAKYLEVLAGVRYWKDAEVNGVEDVEGNLIPFRQNDLWKPIIDIENGVILDWPQGMLQMFITKFAIKESIIC